MKTIQLYLWIAVTLTALTSLPTFFIKAAEEILLGPRSFEQAMETVQKKFNENTTFTNPPMQFMKQRRMGHAKGLHD